MSVPRPAAVIVLAAGEGTRMKSQTPKVLHELCGRALVDHMLSAARDLGPERSGTFGACRPARPGVTSDPDRTDVRLIGWN